MIESLKSVENVKMPHLVRFGRARYPQRLSGKVENAHQWNVIVWQKTIQEN